MKRGKARMKGEQNFLGYGYRHYDFCEKRLVPFFYSREEREMDFGWKDFIIW